MAYRDLTDQLADLATLEAAGLSCGPAPAADAQPAAEPAPRFVAVHFNVMRGSICVARAMSHTFAKRIANALNNHKPNREGV